MSETIEDTLAIVPARGGSVGIPRKNLRALEGKPLVIRKLEEVRAAGFEKVVCATDDPTIASLAHLHGFDVYDRDGSPPDETIADLVVMIASDLDWHDRVAVFQPTSPCTSPDLLAQWYDEFLDAVDNGLSTAATSEAVKGLLWHEQAGQLTSRRNRQYQTPVVWRETGAALFSVSAADLKTMHGGHHLIESYWPSTIDIDTPGDLLMAKQALLSSNVVFMPIVSKEHGAGHIHRCLSLADELPHHDVSFYLVTPEEEFDEWQTFILDRGHQTIDDPRDFMNPGVVVLDRLDTEAEWVLAWKNLGWKVVTLEDLGQGARFADVIVNELYAPLHHLDNEYTGPEYAVVRPEFLAVRHIPSIAGSKVLVSFGGTDPRGMNARIARACALAGLEVTVAALPGKAIEPIEGVTVVEGGVMAELMVNHDILVTSCGRTVHEAAAVGLPTIAIPVNSREEAHVHVPGIVRLQRAELVKEADVADLARRLLNETEMRAEMSATMSVVDGKGALRIADMIDQLAGE